MKSHSLVRAHCVAFLAAIQLVLLAPVRAASFPKIDEFTGKPRVIILSDIGNEPDDQMSLVRLLLYSNELDITGLIATTSTWQKSVIHPETMHALIHAYGKVRGNLLLHAKGWPKEEDLEARVYTGQTEYGLAGTGAGKTSAGAMAIVRALEQEDSRPLWICIWGGANTLAQALLELRHNHSQADLERLIEKLRVYSISDQDDAGPWIRKEFPGLSYIVQPSPPNGEEYYYATWTGISGDAYYRNGAGADIRTVTNEWLDQNIRNKGQLGKAYPRFLFIMEGDTPSFLNLIDNGLNGYRRPDWGGWGGRYVYRQPHGESHAIWTQGGDLFSRVTSQDTVAGMEGKQYVSDQATIWRWREAFQHDFAARMDWTISDFQHANHNPLIQVNGKPGTEIITLDAEVGKSILLDAAGTADPDGQNLHYTWFHYPEAGGTGTNLAEISISAPHGSKTMVTPTAVCRPKWLPLPDSCKGTGTAHIILAVTDDGSPSLTSYRRIVLTVHPKTE